jgi:hypothetical protein
MGTLAEAGADPGECAELLARLTERPAAARCARERVAERDTVERHLKGAVVVDLVAENVDGRS